MACGTYKDSGFSFELGMTMCAMSNKTQLDNIQKHNTQKLNSKL